jgi:hypothetical protein
MRQRGRGHGHEGGLLLLVRGAGARAVAGETGGAGAGGELLVEEGGVAVRGEGEVRVVWLLLVGRHRVLVGDLVGGVGGDEVVEGLGGSEVGVLDVVAHQLLHVREGFAYLLVEGVVRTGRD